MCFSFVNFLSCRDLNIRLALLLFNLWLSKTSKCQSRHELYFVYFFRNHLDADSFSRIPH